MFGQYAAQYADRYHMMNGGDWEWGVFMILFWLILTVGIIILVVRFMEQNSSQQKGVDPLKTVQGRYAKGELSKQEYEQIKKGLIEAKP